MATLHQAIYERLTAAAAVSALVSTRVYPAVAPQGAALPYCTFQRISSEHPAVYSGASGIARHRLQVDCWASSSAGAQALADAVRGALHAFRGSLGATAALAVRGLYLDSMIDDVVPPEDASEQGPFRVTLDFTVWHVET